MSYFNNPTRTEVYDELIKQEVLFPDIVLRQAITETNCGKTGVGKTKNNLFGFRNKSGYIYFKSFKASISYYKQWQDRKYLLHLKLSHKASNCDYYHFLEAIGFKTGKPYNAKEKGYTNYLKKIKLNFNN